MPYTRCENKQMLRLTINLMSDGILKIKFNATILKQKKKKICIQFSLQISFEQNKLCFFVEEKKRIEKPIDLSRALKSQKYFFLMESNLENWISKEID